ncbi:protein spinster homolog 1 isoform X3 [Macaca fascicularis]|uniref:protein spinster homolog 1 isoform X3 n=1 Tax=Macaca fascicularis TaxID=9541 RepID=UPI003D1572C2
MAGSDTAPFLSQADDPDDGPVPGNPGLPGSMGNPKSEEPEVPDQEGLQRITGLSPGHSALIVAVLCYINLLNYMDRFTVAGVLPDIEQFFNIGDSSSGLIQTVFISSYMVLAPVFGYLGDRYNRKYLMCGGIAFWSLVTLGSSFIPGEIFIFIGETLLSMNWAIVADILLYVVIPTRRSTAEAFQIVLSHLLGDAGSPYLIGLISDRLRRNWPPSFLSEFRALQFSLMLCAFVGALGGAAFLGTAIFIEGDRRRAQLHVQGLLHEAGPTDDQIVVPQRGRSTRVPVASVLI